MPSLNHDDQPSSLIDVDSPHIQEVKSDFKEQAVKTETQADRMAQEAEQMARADAKKAEDKAEDLKKKAATKSKEAKSKLKEEGRYLDDNKDNPVFIGNAILWAVTVVAVGYGAYQKHTEGKLDLQLAGTVALGLGALGAADYVITK